MSTYASRHYSLSERARRFMAYELWNLAVVDQPAADIAARGITVPPRWFPSLGSVMLADPACRLTADGGAELYAERMDCLVPPGEIWSAVVAPQQDWTTARFQPLLRPSCHTSYPFPFTDDSGRTLLTAETWQAGCAQLWEQRQDGPRLLGPLMAGREVVDPTLWRGEDGWWLFCSLHDVDPDGALFLFHAPTIEGPWEPHPANPICTGRDGSRPAGPLFRATDGTLVRPAQDCSRTYGGSVVLHAVERLDRTGYRERVLRRLDPQPGPYAAGLHTICPAGEVTLIDGKQWRPSVRSATDKLLRRVQRLSPGRGR